MEGGTVSLNLKLVGVADIKRQLESVKKYAETSPAAVKNAQTSRGLKELQRTQDLISLINSQTIRPKVKLPTRQVSSFNKQLLNLAGSLKTAAVAAASAAFSVAAYSIARIGIASSRAEVALRGMASGYNEVAEAQEAVKRLASGLDQSVLATTQTFAKFYGSLRGIEGFTLDDVQLAFRGVDKAARLSGAGTSELQSTLLAVKQSLSSGVVNGDELRAIRESAPIIAQELAKVASIEFGFDVGIGDLKKLGAEGKLVSRLLLTTLKNIGGRNAPDRAPIDQLTYAWQDFGKAISDAFGPVASDLAIELSTQLKIIGVQITNLTTNVKELWDGFKNRPEWLKILEKGIFGAANPALTAGFELLNGAGGNPDAIARQIEEDEQRRENELDTIDRLNERNKEYNNSIREFFGLSSSKPKKTNAELEAAKAESLKNATKEVAVLQEIYQLRERIAEQTERTTIAQEQLSQSQKGQRFGEQTKAAATAVADLVTAQRAEAANQQKINSLQELFNKLLTVESENSVERGKFTDPVGNDLELAIRKSKELGIVTKTAFVEAGEALRDILDSALNRVKNARQGLSQALVTKAQAKRDPNGIGQFLSSANASRLSAQGAREIFRQSDLARARLGTQLEKEGNFAAARDIRRRPQRETVSDALKFTQRANEYLQASDSVKDAQKELNLSTRDLTGVQIEVKNASESLGVQMESLNSSVGKLADKQWSMNIQVAVDGQTSAVEAINGGL